LDCWIVGEGADAFGHLSIYPTIQSSTLQFICVHLCPSVVNMPLPDLIEIVPLDQPVRAEITVPGSKSITNRALILAALANGDVTLKGALWSEDTQIMVDCLKELRVCGERVA